MRPSLAPDPRLLEAPRATLLGALGGATLRVLRMHRGMATTLLGAAVAAFQPGAAASSVVRRILLLQILYTGVQALPLVSVVALLLGATIILQSEVMAAGVQGEMLGKILVAVVLRELAPLVTAVLVAGRSGTAIATELGSMKVNAEVLALSSLGIDPQRYIVVPRIAGVAVSVVCLTIFFAATAVAGGYVVSQVLTTTSFAAVRAGITEALTPLDLASFLLKGVGLGTIVGWLCCHFGLEVQVSPTEVPQKASRAVIMSMLGCVIFNTAVTAVFYLAVGSPVR